MSSREEEILERISQESLQLLPIADNAAIRNAWPVYKLLRAPQHVRELCPGETDTPTAIWTENGTLVCI